MKAARVEDQQPEAGGPDDSIIDFTELAALGPKGEGLEALAERLLAILGCDVKRSGRGADGGKDLFAIESVRSDVAPLQRTWLVQCKDHAKSRRAVNESDVGSITDLCRKHQADGYLLVTTTGPTKELSESMERISADKRDALVAACWDSHRLRQLLYRPDAAEILREYLPESYRRLRQSDPEAILLEALKAKGHSTETLEAVRDLLSRSETTGLSSRTVFPFSTGHREEMDRALTAFLAGNRDQCAEALEELPLEEWSAVVEAICERDSEAALGVLRLLASSASEEEVRFQSVRTILKRLRPSVEELLKSASQLNAESISILLADLGLEERIGDALEEYVRDTASALFEDLPPWLTVTEVTSGEHTYDTSAPPDELRVLVIFDTCVEYDYDSSGEGPRGSHCFPAHAAVVIGPDGKIDVEDLSVDTSKFFE